MGDLSQLVGVGDGGQDGLVVAAGHHLDLTASRQGLQAGQEVGPMLAQPVQEAAAVVQGETDAPVALQRRQQRQVGLLVDGLEDVVDVADGLVVVDSQAEVEAGHESSRYWRNSLSTIFSRRSRPTTTR